LWALPLQIPINTEGKARRIPLPGKKPRDLKKWEEREKDCGLISHVLYSARMGGLDDMSKKIVRGRLPASPHRKRKEKKKASFFFSLHGRKGEAPGASPSFMGAITNSLFARRRKKSRSRLSAWRGGEYRGRFADGDQIREKRGKGARTFLDTMEESQVKNFKRCSSGSLNLAFDD